MKLGTLEKVLIILCLSLAVSTAYFWFKCNVVTLENRSIINDLSTQYQKNIDELSKKLLEIQSQRDKNLEEYKRSLEEINLNYASKISELEKKKDHSAGSIVKKFKGNMLGLAQELSNVMGIKVSSSL